jgi:hypothetical protein
MLTAGDGVEKCRLQDRPLGRQSARVPCSLVTFETLQAYLLRRCFPVLSPCVAGAQECAGPSLPVHLCGSPLTRGAGAAVEEQGHRNRGQGAAAAGKR